MTAPTACGEQWGPGAAWQHLRCPFVIAWGVVAALSRDEHRSSPLLKAPSSGTPETAEPSDCVLGGGFGLPSGTALAPLAPVLRGRAVEAGEELVCREKTPFLPWFDPICHAAARAGAAA